MTPTPRDVCTGQKLVIEYYFIYGVKEFLKPMKDPMASLTGVTVRITSKIGSVSPAQKTLRGGFTLGGSTLDTFVYNARKPGSEVLTVEISDGSATRGRATLEFPVSKCRYVIKWSKNTTLDFEGVKILSNHSGTAEANLDEQGQIQEQAVIFNRARPVTIPVEILPRRDS